MATAPNQDDAQAMLERLGIAVPAEDIPFLQRTLLRQREQSSAQRARISPETEPAHIFKTVG